MTSHVDAYVWNVGEVSVPERRSPLAWLSRAGIGLLSFFANSTNDASGGSYTERQDEYVERRPQDGAVVDDKCCHLALPNTECHYSGDKSNYTCPSGWYRQWWFCCEGTRQVGCGECTRSTTTCWSGPFICSIWWWTGRSC